MAGGAESDDALRSVELLVGAKVRGMEFEVGTAVGPDEGCRRPAPFEVPPSPSQNLRPDCPAGPRLLTCLGAMGGNVDGPTFRDAPMGVGGEARLGHFNEWRLILVTLGGDIGRVVIALRGGGRCGGRARELRPYERVDTASNKRYSDVH